MASHRGLLRRPGVSDPNAPPRFAELRANDPVRATVQRVILGEAVQRDEITALVRALADARTGKWRSALAAAWALGRAPIEPNQRSAVVEGLAVLL
ncbi:MAG: hypothetical protein FJX72_00600 [Armatimonadetes bacterium]|nr:hypothetical protein [Armatimonadota bacterium]